MRLLNMVLFITASGLLLAACGSNPSAPGRSGETKGQKINKCMAKGSPEECDRRINRGSRY